MEAVFTVRDMVTALWRLRHRRCLGCGALVQEGRLSCGTGRCTEQDAEGLFRAVWQGSQTAAEAARMLASGGAAGSTASE